MPSVDWKVTGSGAVVAETQKVTAAQKAFTRTIKETSEETKRYDRLAKGVIDRQTPAVEKYRKSVLDLVQVLRTQRGVTQEMAEKELARLAQQYLVVENRQDSLAKSAVRAFGSVASSIAGASAFMAALRADVAEFDRMAEERARLQRTVGDAERDLRISVAAESPATRRRLLEGAEGIARDLPADRTVVFDAARRAYSATGDVDRGLANARAALQLTGGRPGGDQLAGAIGDIGAAIGSTDPNAAIGFTLRSLAKTRTEDAPQLAKNLAPVLAFGKTLGDKLPEVAAAFATITQVSADRTGEQSRTATIQLLRQSDKFFAGEAKAGRFKLADVDEFDEQVRRLRADALLRSRFLEDSSFEAGSIGAIRSLLENSDPKAREIYQGTVEALSGDLAAAGAEAQRFVGEGPLQRGQEVGRAIAEATQRSAIDSRPILTAEEERQLVDLRLRAYREAGRAAAPGGALLPSLDRPFLAFDQFLSSGDDGALDAAEAAATLRGSVRDLRYLQRETGAPSGAAFERLVEATERMERAATLMKDAATTRAASSRQE